MQGGIWGAVLLSAELDGQLLMELEMWFSDGV